ncbi:MAG: hypothetical protein CVV14_06305 [Gammaproteobacteria bacterium HGW-Gammaproteobacteria-4]|nr:MAG: hypothetical protein CVV14_06305 [Gammaproteobacteria bacterium HGW-Gammaproteobacteria-4]
MSRQPHKRFQPIRAILKRLRDGSSQSEDIAMTWSHLLRVAMLCLAGFAGMASAQDYAEQQRKAAALLDALDAGQYDAARADFDAAMSEALPTERLRQVWQSLPQQLGAAKERGPAHPEQINGLSAVVTPLHYSLASLDALVTFDSEDRINGFRLVPGKPPEHAPAPAPQNAPFSEREVTVGPDESSLPGTLTLPRGDGPFPAVVLLAGSGPNDRDESIGPNKPLRDLAYGLATHNIAVLRYDKRSHARAEDFSAGDYTVEDEVIRDALAATKLLRKSKGIDRRRVFVLGHSLGAMLAPRIAAQDKRIAGLILLAPPARPLEDAIVDQMTYLAGIDGHFADDERAAIDTVREQGARVRALQPGDMPAADTLPLNIPASYWLDLKGYDPVAAALKLRLPMLVLHGGRDYQVTAAEFARWQQASWPHGNNAGSRVTLKDYPRLNHLFMAGDGPSTPAEYAQPGNVDAGVIADIAIWINAH